MLQTAGYPSPRVESNACEKKYREQLRTTETHWLVIKQKHSNIKGQHAQCGATNYSMPVPCIAELNLELRTAMVGRAPYCRSKPWQASLMTQLHMHEAKLSMHNSWRWRCCTELGLSMERSSKFSSYIRRAIPLGPQPSPPQISLRRLASHHARPPGAKYVGSCDAKL